MKVLVTGVGGQLGYDVVRTLDNAGYHVIAPTHQDMDITDAEMVSLFLSKSKPDFIIHCAAWTNVDLAEDEEYRCRLTNVKGTEHIVNYCKKADIPLLYISTDYVFNGKGEEPWKVDDRTDPQNVYGLSKRDGEIIVKKLDKYFIIRISWVFGINGKNFVKTMLNLSRTRDKLSVIFDQIGSPTYTADLAILISQMIKTDRYGTYHACNQGYCSWYDFAKKIFELSDIDITVEPIDSDSWPSKVKRPKNSRLDTSSLTEKGFNQLPNWEDALKRFLDKYKSYDLSDFK